MRASLPRHQLQGHLGLRAVLEADHEGLLQHADGLEDAMHSAPAAALGLARLADAREIGAELLVGGELVEQAALEPAAVAEKAVVGQGHVLGLRHLHRDRLELPEPGGAAELAAARADPVHHLGGVAGADLAHLDAGAELAGQIPDQLPEIHAVFRVEQDGHAPAVGLDVHVHHLQVEALLPGTLLAGHDRAPLALASLPPVVGLGGRRLPDHLPEQAVTLGLGERALGAPDLAHGGAGGRLDDAEVPHVEVELLHQVLLGLERLAEPDPDQVLGTHINGWGFRLHRDPNSLRSGAGLARATRSRGEASEGGRSPPPSNYAVLRARRLSITSRVSRGVTLRWSACQASRQAASPPTMLSQERAAASRVSSAARSPCINTRGSPPTMAQRRSRYQSHQVSISCSIWARSRPRVSPHLKTAVAPSAPTSARIESASSRRSSHAAGSCASASPGRPWLARARSRAVPSSIPRASRSATASSSWSGMKRTTWQRESTVAGSSRVWARIRMMTVRAGGSSRVFRKA